MKYKILMSHFPSDLQKTVNAFLYEGWSLAGGIAINDGYYYQAVFKSVEIKCTEKTTTDII